MRTSFFTVCMVLTCLLSKAQVYPQLNISLLAHLDPETDTTGQDGRKYSGCWGWYQAAKNREYALCGTSSGTYFVDVTNPASPVIADYVAGRHAGCTWREIKNYQNYCYIVSDDVPPNSFQIVDMQYLPDSVHVVYDDTTYFERSHTIFVDGNKLYCGYATPHTGGPSSMRVYSLANPVAPVLLRKLEQDYPSIQWVHDMFVRNDTVYASCGNQGLYIFRLESNNTITGLAQYSGYPESGYNHSSWQTDNRKTLVFTDEVPAGLAIKVLDVSDFGNLTLKDTVRSHYSATPHNPYIMRDTWCWVSSYQDGLYLYDITNPSAVAIHGFFDTCPQHGANDNFSTDAYRGNWGAYPYLPSKIVIAQDMQNGIFILDPDNAYKATVGLNELHSEKASMLNVYPNPAQQDMTIVIANQANTLLEYTITDVHGCTVKSGHFQPDNALTKEPVNVKELPSGHYVVSVKGKGFIESKPFVIQR